MIRFTQPDPSGQEQNPYLYAAGDPINQIDPAGLWPEFVKASARFIRDKGPVSGQSWSVAPAGCYAKKAWEDTDNSLKDEAADLNDCFNPYAWATE